MNPDTSPFLVLGAGRGGTSLLGACLAGHSRVALAMELFGWTHLMGNGLRHQEPARIFEERVQAFREGCLGEIRKHRGKSWGDKLTTEQLFGLEDHNALNPPYADLLARFFAEAVPEFRVVYILRDGRACVASKVRRTGQSWEHAAFRWHYAVRALKAVRALARPTCVVRFEDLVADPKRALETVCDYLGLSFEEAMLRQTDSKALLPEYRQGSFDEGTLAVPSLPPHIAAFLQPDLEYAGYG
jgi:hypothetical protein